jgi:hypothetical protein
VKRDGWIYIMLVTNGECSYTMHNVQCTMYNAQCTMHNVQCTISNHTQAHVVGFKHSFS